MQFFIYVVNGLLMNGISYALYLLLISYGFNLKLTITMLYLTNATIGFFSNRNLVFLYKGTLSGSGIRYILTHCLGYFINLSILHIFVNEFGYKHEIVQATAIIIVSIFLFVSFKFFVFKSINNQDI